MNSKQIQQELTQWAYDTFQGAYTTRVEKSEFGGWNVHVEWDDEGCFEEIHHYVIFRGQLRSLGVTEIQA